MVIEGLLKTLRKNESLQCILPRTYQIDLRTRRCFFGEGLAIFLLFLVVTPLPVFGYFRHSMRPLNIVAMDALAGAYALGVGRGQVDVSFSMKTRLKCLDGRRCASWSGRKFAADAWEHFPFKPGAAHITSSCR
jgi:hypothetical protein